MDRIRLEYEIRKNGLSIDDFCNKMGFSRCTYLNKVTGKTAFTIVEVEKAMDILGIKNPVGIFFTMRVAER